MSDIETGAGAVLLQEDGDTSPAAPGPGADPAQQGGTAGAVPVLNTLLAAALADGAAVPSPADGTTPALGAAAAADDDPARTAVSPLAYLADLLHYATTHLRDGALPVTADGLARALFQPFDTFPVDRTVMEGRVLQVRLCIEVLRRYAATVGTRDEAAVRALAEAEGTYRMAAYTALLSAVGTSYQELRLASEADFVEIAKRIGMDTTRLKSLLLAPAQVTEPALEARFGLRDTARPPFTGPEGEPVVQASRRAVLRERWSEVDRAAPRPLIDPDLVREADLRTPDQSDAAFRLWRARDGLVRTLAARLEGIAADGARSEPDRFDALLAAVYSAADLATLAEADQARRNGEPFTAKAAAIGLSASALVRLMEVRTLAQDGDGVAPAEWDDVVGILVQAWKRGQDGPWRDAEATDRIVLGPDHFRVPPAPEPSFPPRLPEPLPAWRASAADRRAWEERLAARLEQDAAVGTALAAAVAAVEETSLPALRDALVAFAGDPARAGDLEAQGKGLTDRLLVDTRTSGRLATTRAAQAIETLQGVLFSVRTGQLLDTEALSGLSLAAPSFDAEWEWIGSYATWRAAMFVFLYPENVLEPTLRRAQTPGFRALLARLRGGRPTPTSARELARGYADYLRDVCSLAVGARAQVAGAARDGRTVEYSFALVPREGGAAPRAYWCARALGGSTPEIVAFWDVIPGVGRVVELLGATAYRPVAGDRFVYLFLRLQEADGREKLAFVRHNTVTGAWSGEPVVYDKVEDLRGAAAWVLASGIDERPRLAIRPGAGVPYNRSVDAPGTQWSEEALAGNAWKSIPRPGLAVNDSVLVAEDAEGRLRIFFDEYHSSGEVTWSGSWWTAVENPGGGGFGAWEPFNDGAVAMRVIPGPDRRLHAFYVSLGGHLFHRPQAPAGVWAPPEALSAEGRTLRDVDAALNADGRLEVFGLATDGTYWHRWETAPGAGWSEWERLGNEDDRGINIRVARNVDGSLEAFSLGTANDYWRNRRYPDGSWTGWNRIGNPDDKGLTLEVETNADGRLELFSVGMAGDLWNAWQAAPDSHEWRGWARIGGEETRAHRIRPVRGGDGALQAFITFRLPLIPWRLGLVMQARQNGPGGEFSGWVSRSGDNQAARDIYPFRRADGRVVVFLGGFLFLAMMEMEPLPGQYPAPDLVPVWNGPFAVTDQPDGGLAGQRLRTLQALQGNLPAVHPYFEEAWYQAPVQIALELKRGGHYTAALDWLRTVYDYAVRQPVWAGLPVDPGALEPYVRGDGWLRDPLDPHALAAVRRNAHTRFVLQTIARCVLDYADAEFTRDTAETVPRARTLYITALELLERAGAARAPLPSETPIPTALRSGGGATLAEVVAGAGDALTAAHRALTAGAEGSAEERSRELISLRGLQVMGADAPAAGWTPGITALVSSQFRIPPNPLLAALRMWASINLYKIRTGRNIAGVERELDPYAAPTDAVTGVPGVGLGGGIVGRQRSTRPAPYRYAVLMERARQLTAMAQQVEAAYLSAIERREAEAYTLLRARQDVVTAGAGVRLGDYKVTAERSGVKLAELQLERSSIHAEYYDDLLEEGLNGYEIAAVALQGAAVVAQGAATAAYWGEAGFTFGLKAGQALAATATTLQMTGGLMSMLGSFERRQKEWAFQLELAQQDVRVGRQQVVMANDRVRVAQQERVIADLQATHAADVVEFLGKKFTSLEMYDWMTGVLGEVYRAFLQQAVSLAVLAEGQLEFERQETVPAIIRADYWEPADALAQGTTGPKREGITGSARLLRDLQQLDDLSFATDRRRQNLTRTFSLARLAPVEFQRFRDTGVMEFQTPELLFDQDFPGHYARQIRRVRTSVIALVPPVQGIRATLSTTRRSRVVAEQNGGFVTRSVPDGPASVALSAAADASGVFELDVQPQMRLPFEGLGVDNGWRLEMPRAANLFDYSTIADVLVTLEYTALESGTRRMQVLPTLPTGYQAMRPYSFRHQFADQWYDLHHPVAPASGMRVAFRTVRADFPANLRNLRLSGIALKVSVADEVPLSRVETLKVWLRHDGVAQPVLAQVGGGIITTDGAAAGWTELLKEERAPMANWEIAFEDKPEVRALFAEEVITDLTFVLSFAADFPERG